MNEQRAKRHEAMPAGKGITSLLVLYALIAGPAIWKVRQTCELLRDDCSFRGLVDVVLSERLMQIGSILIVAVLIQVTWLIVGRMRGTIQPAEEDESEARFRTSALPLVLVVFVLWLGGSMLMVFDATGAHLDDILDSAKANWFIWSVMLALNGSAIIYMILWHLNDYFAKPVSNVLLLVLFLATLGTNYMVLKMLFLNG